MAGIDGQQREYVRRAWNKFMARNDNVYVDGRMLPREGGSVDRLIGDFDSATVLPKIGPDTVRYMIDRLVEAADDWNVSDFDIFIHFGTAPFGAVNWRPSSGALDAPGVPSLAGAEMGDAVPARPEGQAGTPGEVTTDALPAAVVAALTELATWALSEGLKMLKQRIEDWLTKPEVYTISLSDRTVNAGSALSVWVGNVDDTANVFLNDSFIGAADIQFPAGANFGLQSYLKPGRNVLMVEHRNSGRGRWSVAGRFFLRGQAWGNVWGGQQDDGLMDRTRIFICNIHLQ